MFEYLRQRKRGSCTNLIIFPLSSQPTRKKEEKREKGEPPSRDSGPALGDNHCRIKSHHLNRKKRRRKRKGGREEKPWIFGNGDLALFFFVGSKGKGEGRIQSGAGLKHCQSQDCAIDGARDRKWGKRKRQRNERGALFQGWQCRFLLCRERGGGEEQEHKASSFRRRGAATFSRGRGGGGPHLSNLCPQNRRLPLNTTIPEE